MSDVNPAMIPSGPNSKDQPHYLPARMLNEYTYCPRLGYLMWVQGEFADNLYTEHGRYQHRRVDAKDGTIPCTVSDENAPSIVRSVLLSGERCRLIAKIDLVELSGESAVPVDYKRGKKPDIPEGAYEPERVQLCAQGILLRENGYSCDHGVLYFIGSKERVVVQFDEELIHRTSMLAEECRSVASSGCMPPPLADHPKCNGCSLVGICLPDETGMLIESEPLARKEPRRLIPARDDALAVYVQSQGAYVCKSGETLVVKEKDQKTAVAKLFETSQLVLMGNIQVTTQTVQELCRRGIPLIYLSTGGWYYGMTQVAMHKNVEQRIFQYRTVVSPELSLRLARRFVSTKIKNCRTLLRRNGQGVDKKTLQQLREAAQTAEQADSSELLLGVEGNAAKCYFGAFAKMLKRNGVDTGFSFNNRNRRPPRDSVNALLSLAYSLLVKELVVVLTAAGFDPYLGFYHKPRYGRPSLALDLMEEFRPLVADSTVIGVINNEIIKPTDFVNSAVGVNLKSKGRRAFIAAFERRLDQLIRHPVFGYKISYRRVLDVQARLLGRYLSGEIEEYPEFTTR